MSRGSGSRSRAALALATIWAPVALSLVVGTASAGPAPAAQDRPAVGSGALSVRITDLSPAIPGPRDTVTVRGTITNVSAVEVSGVLAGLRLSPEPLPSRGEIAEILAGEGRRTGLPVGERAAVADSLGAGAAVGFELAVAVDDLGLGPVGTYMVGAEALGDAGTGVASQDLDRTFLPWWPEGTAAQPLALTTLWPVTAMPQRDAEGVQLSEQSALQMSPTGRLSTLVDAAAEQPGVVTLLVDPATVEDARAMADGYDVRAGDDVVAGTRSREVSTWLADLRAAVNEPGAAPEGMLYAWPDLMAARRGGLVGMLLGQRPTVDAASKVALGRPLPAEIVLFDGATDTRMLTRLERAGVTAAVLSDSVLTPPGTYFTPSGNVVVPTKSGQLPVLATDAGLSATLAMPLADSADRTAARQRLLAETLTTITELPGAARLLVAAPDPGWSPPAEGARMVVGTLAAAPWIEPTSMARALAREPSSVTRELVPYGETDRAQELPPQHVGQVGEQVRMLDEYAAVLAEPDDLPPAARTAPSRGLSAWFRNERVAGARLADAVSAEMAAALASVRIISSGSISISGTSGAIPITVENLGPAPVTVGLEMSSDPPQLFLADPVEAFTLAPGRRTSLEVTALVAAAGPIPVLVQLVTSEGQRFGTPVELTVSSSAYANAARIIVRVALVALVLAVAVHGVRRWRRMHPARPAREAGTDLQAKHRSEVSHG